MINVTKTDTFCILYWKGIVYFRLSIIFSLLIFDDDFNHFE